MTKPPSILVIGAGLIGAALAFRLSRAGADVTVIDAGLPAGAASGRSFGWINASFHLTPAHFRLRAEGIAAHHRLAQDLPGGPIRWCGCLSVEEEGAAQEATFARLTALGYRVDRLTKAEVARRLPALAHPRAALWFPDEGVAEADALTRQLLAASGARVVTGLPALALAQTGSRISGAVTPQGQIRADHTLVAAGTGAPALLAPLGHPLPMLPRPGLMLTTAPLPPVLPFVLVTAEGELRQDAAGRLLMPTAAGHQGDASDAVTGLPSAHADAAAARLAALFPGLAPRWQSVTLAHRPVPGDGLPVLGTLAPGLSVAVLHSGVTLAAITAELLADQVLTGRDSPLLADFRPARFAAGQGSVG